ncbi:MAG: SCP2 sterol-binding domain-containing protein [Nitrososphaerota archaeon]|jgi:putative sterol carrier protein|nr:SCP2 sterol-binding domain-containing protein [Nitrososphaerota archaeon]MDG6957282.1 SCP2 sterol-binding domain-containing protein [Nitrososphaerota archaeon]MDG6959177.1 SCP2 sterol-binding domain-containing protein [Nitrososphaerota archaeon]MDG6965383.1 SCP2 sterol-binding domain-containing protein [Nitrososphaerota archaeon]MDG6968784.1 SCP2 sterol-binding domain-containing protein [Nitrososphaerota archaeon]
MSKFMSDEYISQVQSALTADPKWTETTKGFKTSVSFNVTDSGQNFLMTVENGATAFQKAEPGASAEFSFDGTYETWCKVARGELDLQSAVLKGQLRFKGSLPKIIMYRERLTRVAEIMKDVPKEF